MVQVAAELKLTGGLEFFNHPNQICERLCVHLLHDMGAMKFDRSLGSSEFAGYLLIKQTRCDESHHFTLTWGELFITFAQFFRLRSLFVR